MGLSASKVISWTDSFFYISVVTFVITPLTKSTDPVENLSRTLNPKSLNPKP